MRTFHHVGVVVEEPQPGERHVPALDAWVTDPAAHPQRLQSVRFAAGSPAPEPVRTLPHFAFQVDDLERELAGKEVLFGPFEARPGVRGAFILEDGGVLELLEL